MADQPTNASLPIRKSAFHPLLNELLEEARGINSSGLNRLIGQANILKERFPIVPREGFGKIIPFARVKKEISHV